MSTRNKVQPAARYLKMNILQTEKRRQMKTLIQNRKFQSSAVIKIAFVWLTSSKCGLVAWRNEILKS